MAYAKRNHQTFDLGNGYTAECWSEKTRYGFRHLAELRHNGSLVRTAKAIYYNRTWESFEYQSVLLNLVNGAGKAGVDAAARDHMRAVVENYKEPNAFNAVGMVMAFGNILAGDSDEKKVAWKKRMAVAAGLDFPDDFDSLPIEERKRRLEAVEGLMRAKE